MLFRLKIPLLTLIALSWASLAMGAVTVGEKAPEFKLKGVDGKEYALSDFKGKNVVLEWYNRGCPFVRKHYDSGNMQALQKRVTAAGDMWFTIISSAEGEQGAADEKSGQDDFKREKMAATALLLDTPGKVGRLYEAKTTPHMYVINKEGTLIYDGAIDSIPSASQADIEKSENYVSEALNALDSGSTVKKGKTRPYGCNVKYN